MCRMHYEHHHHQLATVNSRLQEPVILWQFLLSNQFSLDVCESENSQVRGEQWS